MLHILALALIPYVSALNLFTYHTVRAGGAALTGFLFCVLLGPWIIRLLRSLKMGQYIKKDHVAQLHELHKGKAGTPTMGGVMIIVSTVISLVLWGRLSNPMLWVALGVLVLLGAVGFLDDYIKLKRKHNDGLSARAKFAGQVLTGLLLGLYLYNNPVTISAAYVQDKDVLDWKGLVSTLATAAPATEPGSGDSSSASLLQVWKGLDAQTRATLEALEGVEVIPGEDRAIVLRGINRLIEHGKIYDPGVWKLSGEAGALVEHGVDALSGGERIRLNRLLLEDILPEALAASVPDLHTKIGVPGFKDFYIPLGPLYILFVIFVIVSISNAVNITDGLDGLAAGASIVSILAYAAIAYVVSRADWSQYLFLIYVPEASELFVFGAALLGTGLGFLWYNAHPAEVFMGDTGSLALGGALGTMALLTKQELLLPIVAGIFVLEIASVVVQVASYKLTGKRVFRMAPLHHHFELLGWSETKVVLRFWIIALLLALMSLATLKLR